MAFVISTCIMLSLFFCFILVSFARTFPESPKRGVASDSVNSTTIQACYEMIGCTASLEHGDIFDYICMTLCLTASPILLEKSYQYAFLCAVFFPGRLRNLGTIYRWLPRACLYQRHTRCRRSRGHLPEQEAARWGWGSRFIGAMLHENNC